MKNSLFLVLFAVLGTAAVAQTPKGVALFGEKKKLLGVYNTSTFSLMPRTQQATYYPYMLGDVYYPSGAENRVAYSFRNTTGYRFFDALNIGAGVGVENFESIALNLPFYGEVSGNILKRRFTPVYFAQAGYGLGINISGKENYNRIQKAEGGLMLAGGIGFGAHLDKYTLLRLNFGYRLQKASYSQLVTPYNMAPYTDIRHMTYHRIEIGLSFTFQQ